MLEPGLVVERVNFVLCHSSRVGGSKVWVGSAESSSNPHVRWNTSLLHQCAGTAVHACTPLPKRFDQKPDRNAVVVDESETACRDAARGSARERAGRWDCVLSSMCFAIFSAVCDCDSCD